MKTSQFGITKATVNTQQSLLSNTFAGLKITLAIATAFGFAGCSVIADKQDIEALGKRRGDMITGSTNTFAASISDRNQRIAKQNVAAPWIVGKSEPLAREVTLPAALRRNVKLRFKDDPQQMGLAALAERISQVTGIPVTISPEALQPRENFAPNQGEDKTSSLPGAVKMPIATPTGGNFSSLQALQPPTLGQFGATTSSQTAGGTAADHSNDMPNTASLPATSMELSTVLYSIGNRLGVYWKYTDKGVIEFYRTETRTFYVRALPQTVNSESTLGKSGAGASDGSFVSASSTTYSTKEAQNPIDSTKDKIKPFMTKAGQIVGGGTSATNSIVVTDTPAALDKVAKFLERENRALTRRVRLIYEEVTLQTNDDSNGGIDWNLVYSATNAGSVFTGVQQAANATATAGAAALSGSVKHGPFSGSSVIINALNQIGTVVSHTSIPLMTTNRRPITKAIRKSFTYINQTQSTAVQTTGSGGTAGALPSVTVQQKDVTVGQFLTITPDAQDDGQILLSLSYDNTVDQPLTTVKFGTGDNQIMIQQLTVNGNGIVQQVPLRPGIPQVIGGFDSDSSQTQQRRLDKNAPLLFGGADTASKSRLKTIIIVTAQVEEGN